MLLLGLFSGFLTRSKLDNALFKFVYEHDWVTIYRVTVK